MPQPHHNPIPARIRKIGLLKALGGLGGLVSIYLLLRLGLKDLLLRLTDDRSGSCAASYLLAGLLSTPFVLLCIGVLELTTGKPFRRLSSAWNQMNEWKQGGLSFLLIWVGIGIVGLILYLTVRYCPVIWSF
jgi:hypothetical protein